MRQNSYFVPVEEYEGRKILQMTRLVREHSPLARFIEIMTDLLRPPTAEGV